MLSEMHSRKVNTTAIDVCRHNLVKCIKCDVPCSEGYGPGNLITNNFVERNKGFLAERFIKPPVNITLEFNSEIDIDYVVMTCTVGAQKSKGLELFSQSISRGFYYESVASGVLPDEKIGFVFHRYNSNVKDKFGEQYCFRTFKSSRFLSLVNNLKIKIFSTSRTSVPALGKIEIWGTPKKCVPRKDRKILQPKTMTCKKPGEVIVTEMSCKSSEPKTIQSSRLLSVKRRAELDQSFTIPDDFIDPITCDIMIQPIILPSGKVIDVSTLKSHERAELTWGRGPSDPFTGIPFSDSNKPIAASDLKSRIDKFLSDNCNVSELQNVPRTLGTKNTFHVPRKQNSEVVISKLVTKTSYTSQGESLFTDFSSSNTGPNLLKTKTASKRKHARIDSDLRPVFETVNDSRNNLLLPSQSIICKEVVGFSKNYSCAAKARDTFQERMELSLELALKSTLAKLPKFTSEKTVSTEEVSAALCYSCKSIENLFSIPCKHFVCRFCLLKVNSDKMPAMCLLCKSEYKTSSVQKVHTR